MAHTAESIQERLKELKLTDTTFTGKEVKALPGILRENEQLLAATKGRYKNGIGLLCATQGRIIFLNKGFISLKVEEFSLKSVSSISTESGLLLAKIKIFASGNNAEIDQIQKPDAKNFVDEVRRLIEERDAPVTKQTPQTQIIPEPDIYEQIEKLASLKEKGIVTEEEFQAKKAQLLNL